MKLLQLARARGEQDSGSVNVTASSIRCSWIGALLMASKGGRSPGMKHMNERQATTRPLDLLCSSLVFGLVQSAM
jgi:hypothetical protein